MSRLLFVDTETTGLDVAKGHKLVELAMLQYDSDSRALTGKLVQRINPQRSIDPGAQAVHGISFADVAGCPTFKDIAGEVVAIMKDSDVMIAHNLPFDAGFLIVELGNAGHDVPNLQTIDTLEEGRWATPYGKSPNLGELCFALNVPYDPSQAHGAEYDITVTAQAFFAGLDRGFFKLPVVEKIGEAA